MSVHVLVLDNRDSFVHNLARYARELGARTTVVRSDRFDPADRERLDGVTHLIVSPGPCTPAEAGSSSAAIRRLAGRVPVLGVCLGHLCVADAFGGTWGPSGEPAHGRASWVHHDGSSLFAGVPNPFRAGRYHSLDIDEGSLPDVLEVVARSGGQPMALRHRELHVWGVQFHPESILTDSGHRLIGNFLALRTPEQGRGSEAGA